MIRTSTMRSIRSFHLYSGVFFAPAILFFALTGFLQVFALHEPTKGSSYEPPALLARLAHLHKKSTIAMPPDDRKLEAKAGEEQTSRPIVKVDKALPAKIFFGLTALGLTLSTLSGLAIAYQFRKKGTVTLVLGAGVVVPVLLVWLQTLR